MCTYATEKTAVTGSGKGPEGWFRLAQAVVYVDHPYHSPYTHTLNIDLVDAPDGAASQRLAVELTPDSARQLVAAIEKALVGAGRIAAPGGEVGPGR